MPMHDGRTSAERLQIVVQRMHILPTLGMPYIRMASDDLSLFVADYERLKAENAALAQTNIFLQTKVRELREGSKPL